MARRENPYDLLRSILGARVITVSDARTGEILWEELGSRGCASPPEGVGYSHSTDEGNALYEQEEISND